MGDIVEFVSHVGREKIYYEITSGAINFEVKATGNAAIGLSSKIGTECEYLVALGDLRRSWIKMCTRRPSKEKAETPNILSAQEFRRFWISWYGETIRLGGEGHANPIVSFHTYPKADVKYVTFFVLKTHYNVVEHTVEWRVELPPVLERPIMKPLTDGEPHWVPYDVNSHVLPNGAVIGGYEKQNLYIIRAKHRGSLTPGKFVPSEAMAYISWGENAYPKTAYEVLCGFNCIWVPCSKEYIPVGAVIGGYSENIEHEKLYVGRANYLDHIIPGKVQASHQVCYFAYEGKEVGVPNYEILVNPEKSRCANTLIMRPNDEYVSDAEDTGDADDDEESETSDRDEENIAF